MTTLGAHIGDRSPGGVVPLQVSFHGVRGSTPCSCESNRRYGGNTACVSVDAPGIDPLILDIGTGLRFFGDQQPADGSFRGHALVTHLHWDHVQGLPFFVPIHAPGARLDIYGPAQDDGLTLADAFDEFMRPPYFPVGVADLAGDIVFHELAEGAHDIGGAEVQAANVPHIGATHGYRITVDGQSVVYISDHQQPLDGSHEIDPAVLDLCRGADLLIHDAQFTPDEFADKAHWGHCTVDYALAVAAAADVGCLALFHHDPSHDDAELDRLLSDAKASAVDLGVDEVIAAHEGLTIALSGHEAYLRAAG